MDNNDLARGKHIFETGLISHSIFSTSVAPIVLGPPHPYDVQSKKIKNGTVFFVNGNQKFAVTCNHCIKEFTEWQKREVNIFLKIGNAIIWNIDERIIDRDEEKDICTFHFDENDAKRVNRGINFYSYQYPKNISKGSTACIIGFPGVLTKPVSETEMLHGEFCVFETIHEYSEENSSFLIKLRSEEWQIFKNESEYDLNSFNKPGGFSGSPVFFQDTLSSILIGYVSEEFNYEKNTVIIRKTCFDKNGKII